jgi:nitrate reductase NapE component
VAEQRLLQLPDDELGAALRGLTPALAWPDARLAPNGPDLATRVRARLVAAPPARRRSGWRPALVLAIVVLLVLAAVAGAVAFGVPGIRLIFGDPGGTPPPAVASPAAPPTGGAIAPPAGSSIDLGEQVDPASLEDRVDFPVLFPGDPALGAPDATYVSERDEVALVWSPSDDLPPTVESDIGLLLMQFRGSVSPEPIGKIISSGTVVEPVRIGEDSGYWITGNPHVYFYFTPDGEHVEEGRRWVGDALIWKRGDMTYRIETSLGKDAAIRIAESLP